MEKQDEVLHTGSIHYVTCNTDIHREKEIYYRMIVCMRERERERERENGKLITAS